ncbi:hypothetical protein ABK905_07705 [Acerihabitans sp. KWT182]|uniref:Uncharacterized protein n=1 Tax=Acerihabitans sp. KWT182 TaxID=3157919 RepID=A0AAU7QCQ7_9GAMM
MSCNRIALRYEIDMDSHNYYFLKVIAGEELTGDFTFSSESYHGFAKEIGLKRREERFERLQMFAAEKGGQAPYPKGRALAGGCKEIRFRAWRKGP